MERQSVVDHIRGTGAVSALIVSPIVQVAIVRVTPILVCFAVACCLLASFLEVKNPKPQLRQKWLDIPANKVLTFLAASLFFWLCLSLLWGLDPATGIYRVSVVTVAIFAGLYLASQFAKIPHQRLPIVLMLGVAATISSLFFGLEFIAEIRGLVDDTHRKFDFNRIAVILGLITWPLLYCATLGRMYLFAAIILLAGVIAGISASESETAKLALFVGLAVAVCLVVAPKLRLFFLAAMIVIFIAMPFLPPIIEYVARYLPESFYRSAHIDHRLSLWKGAADLSLEKWLFGWGMQSDRVLAQSGAMGEYAKVAGFGDTTVAPHNLSLEVWLNLGLVGVLVVSAILAWLGSRLANSNAQTIVQFGFLTTIFTMVVSGVGSTSLQSWFIFAVAANYATLFALISIFSDKLHNREK